MAFQPWLSGVVSCAAARSPTACESLLLLPTPMVVLAAVAERLLVPLDRRLARSTETTPPITGAAQFRGPPGAVA